jgi:hypothetical protein
MEPIVAFKSGLLEFDLTQSQLARYIGAEPSRVSRAMTGEVPFTVNEALNISETVTAMRTVQAEMSLPIDWSLIGKVKPTVDQRRKDLRDQEDPVVHRCVLIKIGATSYFQRVNSGNVVATPSELNACAFELPRLADEVVRELKKLGTVARTESMGAFRRRSTMTNTLVELGFEVTAATEVELS